MPSKAYGGLSLSVNLPCPSEGEPPVNVVRWKKNGQVINTRGVTIGIHSSTVSQTCLVAKLQVISGHGALNQNNLWIQLCQ